MPSTNRVRGRLEAARALVRSSANEGRRRKAAKLASKATIFLVGAGVGCAALLLVLHAALKEPEKTASASQQPASTVGQKSTPNQSDVAASAAPPSQTASSAAPTTAKQPDGSGASQAQTAPGTQPDSGVKIVNATPKLDVPCEEQVWPYIDRRCLAVAKDGNNVARRAETTGAAQREAASNKQELSPITATGSVAPAPAGTQQPAPTQATAAPNAAPATASSAPKSVATAPSTPATVEPPVKEAKADPAAAANNGQLPAPTTLPQSSVVPDAAKQPVVKTETAPDKKKREASRRAAQQERAKRGKKPELREEEEEEDTATLAVENGETATVQTEEQAPRQVRRESTRRQARDNRRTNRQQREVEEVEEEEDDTPSRAVIQRQNPPDLFSLFRF